MKFEWTESAYTMVKTWDLHLCSKDGVGRRRMGSLYRIEDGRYVVVERNYASDPIVLDADLSLEDAQRAAKLLICTGGAA